MDIDDRDAEIKALRADLAVIKTGFWTILIVVAAVAIAVMIYGVPIVFNLLTDHGIPEGLAWLLPLAIDGALIVGLVATPLLARYGIRAGWVGGLRWVSGAASLVLNTAPSWLHKVDVAGIVIHTFGPLMLFATVEAASYFQREISGVRARKEAQIAEIYADRNRKLEAEAEVIRNLEAEVEAARQAEAEAEVRAAGAEARAEAEVDRNRKLEAEVAQVRAEAEAEVTKLRDRIQVIKAQVTTTSGLTRNRKLEPEVTASSTRKRPEVEAEVGPEVARPGPEVEAEAVPEVDGFKPETTARILAAMKAEPEAPKVRWAEVAGVSSKTIGNFVKQYTALPEKVNGHSFEPADK